MGNLAQMGIRSVNGGVRAMRVRVMQANNMMIVLAFFATLVCAELDLNAVQVNALADPEPSEGQLRVRAQELRVEGLAHARMSVDSSKAISAAQAKEVEHKKTPEKVRLERKNSPITQDIKLSAERERKIKAEKIKREELAAKEIRAKQEKEAKRQAFLKAQEEKSKEQEAKAKEIADKKAAKALREKNERDAKKAAKDEAEEKHLAAVAKEKSDKEAAALRIEQEKAAKSKEKLDKVEAKRAKLVKDKKDAEQTLIDGPKHIEVAKKKIGKA